MRQILLIKSRGLVLLEPCIVSINATNNLPMGTFTFPIFNIVLQYPIVVLLENEKKNQDERKESDIDLPN